MIKDGMTPTLGKTARHVTNSSEFPCQYAVPDSIRKHEVLIAYNTLRKCSCKYRQP